MDLPVADHWFAATGVGGGVTRLCEPWVDPQLTSNVWHVRGRERDLLVDAANGIGSLQVLVGELSEGRPVAAVATHAHYDHVGGLWEFEDRRCYRLDAEMPSPGRLRLMREDFPKWLIEDFAYYGSALPEVVALHRVPEPGFDVRRWSTPPVEATSFLEDGEVVDLGDRAFEVVHTPGHTPGSTCLWEEASGTLFSGDAVYVDDRLEWEDAHAFVSSLRRLAALPVRVVHAGHGRSFDGGELHAVVDRTIELIARGAG